MIGIGYLTLPANCKKSGLIIALTSIVVCGLGSLFGTYLLTKAYNVYRMKNYPELVYAVEKKWYMWFTFVLVGYTFFATSVYIYFGQILLLQIFDKYNYTTDGLMNFLAKTLIFAVSFVLNFVKIDGLMYLGVLAIIFSLFTVFTLALELPQYYVISNPEPFSFFDFNTDFFTSLGTSLFAFVNQYGVISFLRRSKNGSEYTYLSVRS